MGASHLGSGARDAEAFTEYPGSHTLSSDEYSQALCSVPFSLLVLCPLLTPWPFSVFTFNPGSE